MKVLNLVPSWSTGTAVLLSVLLCGCGESASLPVEDVVRVHVVGCRQGDPAGGFIEAIGPAGKFIHISGFEGFEPQCITWNASTYWDLTINSVGSLRRAAPVLQEGAR